MAFKSATLKTAFLKLAAAAAMIVIPSLPASTTLADDLIFGTLASKNVTIEKVEGDRLFYKTQSGTAIDKLIDEKLKVVISDEPNLATAEDTFAAKKWPDAVDAYQKVLRATSKPWLKDFSAVRLLDAGDKSGRFDAVVAAYIHLLGKDPKAAQDLKIKFPEDPNNAYLKTAASQVAAAVAAEKDPTKVLSLDVFGMNIAKAMRDEPARMKYAGELSAGTAAASGGAIDPTALASIVDGKLSMILAAVDKSDFKEARKGLEQVKPSVIDPQQQGEWLWLTAEANSGIAGDTKDAATLKDVAIDYMRVAANFPAGPRASQALLKTASLMEKLNDTKAALAVYQQVARDFDNQPAGSDAKKSVARLGGK